MAEINSTGYVSKTQNEYFDEEKQFYLDIDPSWNVDPSTPDGLKIAHDAEIFSKMDEELQTAYNSKDPDKSRDLELDIISALTGTVRNPGTPSTVTLTLTGTPNTAIASGKRVRSSADSSVWLTNNDVTIPSSGITTIGATCSVVGATDAAIGSINTIVDTVGGWLSVTNNEVAVLGTSVESNAALRLRRAQGVSLPGNNQVDSMTANIYTVSGVSRVKIYENDDSTVDENGVPGHNLSIFVIGGNDADVASAIFLKKNPGVGLHDAGSAVSVSVTSEKFPQNKKTIRFNRPDYVDIAVRIDIVNDGTLPNDADTLIRESILTYINGEMDNGPGFNDNGFGIGENVPISRIYTPINSVIGTYGNSYISNLTLNNQVVNVPITYNQISRWSAGNIQVSIS